MKRLPERCLMLVTEPRPQLAEIVASAIGGGVNVVQWRDKVSAPGEAFNVAWDVSEVTQERAVLLLNGAQSMIDLILIRKVGAQGLHLSAEEARKWLTTFAASPDRLIGCSVHSLDEAQYAADGGADYLIAGTIFASPSHLDVAPAGVDFLREVCTAVSIPVLAIGGVTPENVSDCIDAGAAGVAVLSAIMRADDPRAVAQRYRTALDAAWEKKTCN